MTTDNLPPHSREAECGVIGGILRDPEILPDIQEIISADNFYLDAHQKIFRAMLDVVAAGQPIDLVVLYERLKALKQLDDTGGPGYLADLFQTVPTGANAHHHARIVKGQANRRHLIHAANEILRDAYDGSGSPEDLVAAAERRVFEIASGVGQEDTVSDSDEMVREALQRIDDCAEAGGPVGGISTGFVFLDAFLSRLQPGQLLIVGARPSVGKTALAIGLALNVVDAGEPILFFSLEMSKLEVTQRILSIRCNVPLTPIKEGKLTPEQAAKVGVAGEEFRRQPFFTDDNPLLSAARLAATLRRNIRRRKVKLVVVDYLQLMTPANDRENRTQQVGQIARSLKLTAKACGVPVVALCQLNREVENRTHSKPRLSDLRDSGEIEQHADAVILLSPQTGGDSDPLSCYVDVNIAKNRNGPTGEVTLTYAKPFTRFENAVK